MQNKNNPAFPLDYQVASEYTGNGAPDPTGLTKREFIASKVMQALLSNPAEAEIGSKYVLKFLGLPATTLYKFKEHYPKYIAQVTMLHTEALLKELDQNG